MLLVLGLSPVCAQQNYVVDIDHGTDMTGGAEVDVNNDGYLDLIWGGRARNDIGRVIEDADGNEVETTYQAWQKIWNPATSSYDVQEFQDILGERVYMNFADFNNDGIMDYFLCSSASGNMNVPLGLFLGNGDGIFTQQEITVKTAEGEEFPFRPTAVDLADFNNDGLMDMVAIGYYNDGELHHANSILLNQGNFEFKAIQTDLISYQLALDCVRAADLNNDGYPDFILQGNADNGSGPIKNGKTLGRVFEIYLNLGQEVIDEEGDPAFYALDIASAQNIYHLGNGNIACADFNNDGYMDIFASGESADDGKPADNFEFVHQMLINDGEGNFQPMAQSQISKDIRPLNSTHYGTRAIDYDGDGYYDLFIPGWCTAMPDGSASTQAGFWYKNSGTGVMSSYTRIPGASEIGIFFTEDGVRGARNYFMAGGSWDATYLTGDQQGRVVVTMANTNAKAARPDAPTNLQASVTGNQVQLSWDAAATSKNNVTYEYYLKDKATGKMYTSCSSHVGGELDGVRKLMTMGNAYLNKAITLNNIPDGSYEWGVQTINASYEGSTFAVGSLVVGSGSGVESMMSDDAVKVVAVAGGVELQADGNAVCQIYLVSGQLVNEVSFTDFARVELPSGCYLVKVTAAHGVKVQKVVL